MKKAKWGIEKGTKKEENIDGEREKRRVKKTRSVKKSVKEDVKQSLKEIWEECKQGTLKESG